MCVCVAPFIRERPLIIYGTKCGIRTQPILRNGKFLFSGICVKKKVFRGRVERNKK